MIYILTVFIYNSIFNHIALSDVIRARQYGSESRFKAWTYNPDNIYYYEGFYMYPTYIEFDESETINTMYTPKKEAWQIVPVKNRLFIKPISEDADTTLTVMTNEREYFFELHAREANGPFDRDISFFVKFRYPYVAKNLGNSRLNAENSIVQYTTTKLPDLTKPEQYNFNYTVSGDYLITPIKIFDDGRFTYMEFREKNGVLPAIFSVGSEGTESIINFRILGNFVAIESLFPVFTLRYGSETVCVFNENMIEITKAYKEKLGNRKK